MGINGQDSQVKYVGSRSVSSRIHAHCSCSPAWCENVPERHVIMGVISFKLVLMTFIGAMTPLSVVAMVKTRNTTNVTSDNECPVNDMYNTTVDPDNQNGEFDWDEMTQSYIYSAGSVGALLCYLPTIRLSEVWGPKRVIGVCMAATAVLVALGPAAARTNVWLFIALIFIRGCLSAPIAPSFSILASSWLPAHERARSAGIAFSATIFGMLLSMFTAGTIVDKYGWPIPSYLSAVIAIPFLTMWFYFIYDTPMCHPRISHDERNYIMSTTQKDYIDVTPPAPWLKMLTSGPIWAYISIQISTTWTGFTFGTQLPTYLKNILHFNLQQSSFIAALPHLSNLVSNVFCSTLSEWLRTRNYLSHLASYRIFNFIATIATAMSIVLIAELRCDSTAIVSVLVVAMALNGAYFGGSFMNNLDLAPNFAGSVSALSSTVTGTINIIAPTIIGAITNNQQTLSAWRKVFYVSAAVSATPYLFFFVFGSADEQPWNKIEKKEDEISIMNAEAVFPAVNISEEC